MFPRTPQPQTDGPGFPRVRGDVPAIGDYPEPVYEFSPRARGCSSLHIPASSHLEVFPACAGMFLKPHTRHPRPQSFPRVRGDVPAQTGKLLVMLVVFPACAGMFLDTKYEVTIGHGFPRVRGDVPLDSWDTADSTGFSPRARGCSGGVPHLCHIIEVFPACAGMFLETPCSKWYLIGFPRVRGDVPTARARQWGSIQFSPRARGCSSSRNTPSPPTPVFPACAGMFRRYAVLRSRLGGFPRVRGDVPPRVYQTRQHDKFSPRARGCSHLSVVSAVDNRVFPACAGMFPNDASRR